MRLLRAALVMLPLFAAACGDDDKNGTGDAAAVFPEQGFIGRTTRVAIVGDGTSWDSTTTVNFGDGVTVGSIEVASSSAIFADVTVAPTAPAGAIDVTVTDSGDVSTLAGAFTLQNPFEVVPLLPLAQGGITLYEVTNLDLLHPFDTTTDADGNFTALSVVLAGTGVDAFVADATATTVTIQATADVDATTGAITLTSGTDVSPAGNLEVAARTATPLTLGTPVVATLDSSALYEVELTANQLASFSVASADENASIRYTILPASGKWADVTGGFSAADTFINADAQKFYLSVLDTGLIDGYEYTVLARGVTLPASTTDEDEPNNNVGNAEVAPTAVTQFAATLASETDADFFKVTVTANQTIRVVTLAGPTGETDTQISIFLANGTTLVDDANGDPIDGFDVDFGEDVTTAALPAGTYVIKIDTSQFAIDFFGYAPVNDPYDAIVVVE